MKKALNVAVVGATGEVGKTILTILAERQFPIADIYPLASERSAGTPILFAGQPQLVQDTATFDFSKVDIALFSAGGSVSREYVPKAAASGCIVIDNTSEFRYDEDVPLIIPEVNPHAIADYEQRNIIANPNCSTIQMLVALKPIYDAVGILRINVATYQSVSGAGKKGVKELAKQTADVLNGKAASPNAFSSQIAFNAIPHIDQFEENGYTREEMKMVWETQKIFEDDRVMVNPTAVRVPVFYSHSEAVHIETRDKITANQARTILKQANGVVVIDRQKEKGYPTAVDHSVGKDAVYVGRIREDISCSNGLNLWIVADNVRKGAALNAVQIAEKLLEYYL